MPDLPPIKSPTIYLFDLKGLLYPFFTTFPKLAGRRTYELVEKVLSSRRPTHAAICADTTSPTFRHELAKRLFAEDLYKADRPSLPTAAHGVLLEQLRFAQTLCLDVLGVETIAMRGYEADDLLATLARQAREAQIPAVVVGKDRDLYALVGEPEVVMWGGKSECGQPLGVVGRAEVRAALGVDPEQVADYFAIVGGKNNVPGVPDLGGVGARELLHFGGSVERILDDPARSLQLFNNKRHGGFWRKLVAGEKEARASLQLARLDDHAPMPSIENFRWSL